MKWRKSPYRYGGLEIRKDDCAYAWFIPVNERCEWVKNAEDCHLDSYIQYAQILFCTFRTDDDVCGNILDNMVGNVFQSRKQQYKMLHQGVSTITDKQPWKLVIFCPSLAVIASALHLSENIAGVTILAFGNGSPDIFTSIIADGGDERLIMFTELIGAGIFITAITAGTVAIFSPFRVLPRPFMRDCLFYAAAVIWIAYITEDNSIHLWEDVITMTELPSTSGTRRSSDDADDEGHVSFDGDNVNRPKELFKEFLHDINPINVNNWRTSRILVRVIMVLRVPVMLLLRLLVPVVNETAVKRGWSKLLNCLQLCVTPIVATVILKVHHVTIGPVPIIAIIACFCIIIGVIVFLRTQEKFPPKYHNIFALLGFLTAMLIVWLIAKEVMSVLLSIGFASGISDPMLGVTLLAWGNSISDLISNVAVARQGYPRMGYSACFGGPMFNTLLGLGLPWTISTVHQPDYEMEIRTSEMMHGCLAFLLCSLMCSVLYLNIMDFVARRSYGFLLYTIYFTFMLITFLSEIRVMHPIGTNVHEN
ncbi:hypothetical protein PV327_007884 [Microctonus hyperodae]|uniref:Sodium/calcium exchanger membrane region domain-containing protein n=1 Tax=Microctonus hyperodae TaxID=165561 RepID=A0AA39G1G6_MICHY|nr:hypothetical protein PV327_007884 [Microctonus hyperodae]